MALFMLGALVASCSYASARVVNLGIPGCAGFIGVACLLLTEMFLSPPVLAAAIFCIPGTLAQKAMTPTRTSVPVHYLDLLTTTFSGISHDAVGFPDFSLDLAHFGTAPRH